MRLFWKNGELFVRELLEFYDEPRPHFNTLSTMVRSLEAKGYVSHTKFGTTYRYGAVISEEEFGRSTIRGAVKSYLGDSYLSAVSALVKEEKITVDELKNLIEQIEKGE